MMAAGNKVRKRAASHAAIRSQTPADTGRKLFGFVGDLMVDRERPGDAFADVRELLAAPDVLFGNLEANFTDEPHPAPSGGTPLFPRRRNLDVFAKVGFNVLSMANNHIVDAGHAAMLENRASLRKQGVKTAGCGENLAAAREPAILEVGGKRVAVLCWASVFPMGYEARSNMPGLAPLRAYDFWRPAFDNYHLPGTPPQTTHVWDERDLEQMLDDIAKARRESDVVIASFHWGDFLRPFHLTEHERKTARLCIDRGVDLVVGHHHHALRGMEWYAGKPIFYGLGHFVFDLHLDISAEAKAALARAAGGEADDNYGIFPRVGWPLLPMHADTRMTVLAYAMLGPAGFDEIGFVPCRLRPDGRVAAVDPRSDEGREVLAYVERCNATQRLNARIDDGAAAMVGPARAVRVLPQA